MTTASGRKSRRTPLGAPGGLRSIRSRYGGHCDHCHQKIYVNETIFWSPGHTFHPRCSPAQVNNTVLTPAERQAMRSDRAKRNAWRGQLKKTSDHRSSMRVDGVES